MVAIQILEMFLRPNKFGRVNFIENVRSAGNLLKDRPSFDLHGQNIKIGEDCPAINGYNFGGSSMVKYIRKLGGVLVLFSCSSVWGGRV